MQIIIASLLLRSSQKQGLASEVTSTKKKGNSKQWRNSPKYMITTIKFMLYDQKPVIIYY